MFFIGSECSNCPGYPYILNGNCVQVCPEGYYATDRKICIECSEGYYWDGSNCVKQCPPSQFLNIGTN